MRVAGALLLVIIFMTGIGYWYYNNSQAKLARLNENNAKLQIAVETNEATITQITKDYAQASEELDKVNKQFAVARRQNNELAKKLEKHDLGALAAARPEMVERIINRATEKASRCMELLSGAKLTDQERQAENGKEFNSECPWMYYSLDVSNSVRR